MKATYKPDFRNFLNDGREMKIMIVGAGIAGLAAARAFENLGFAPVLVEREKAPPATGKSIFLLGNATRALADLGLWPEVSKISNPVPTQTILTSDGNVLNKVTTADVWADCGPCVSLLRRELIDVLLRSLSKTSFRYGVEVAQTEMRENQREVTLSDGSQDVYDLVIVADGVNSLLRKKLFPVSSPVNLGMTAARLVVDVDHKIEGWTAMITKGRSLLAIPLGPHQLYMYADCPTNEFRGGTVPDLQSMFADFAAPLGPIVSALDIDTDVHLAQLKEVPAGKFLADRLVLIGDAAHASSPSMAQGAALALEDAIVLARLIAEEHRPKVALERFHLARKDRISWVQHQCHVRDKMRGSSNLVSKLVLRLLGTKLYRRAYRPLVAPL